MKDRSLSSEEIIEEAMLSVKGFIDSFDPDQPWRPSSANSAYAWESKRGGLFLRRAFRVIEHNPTITLDIGVIFIHPKYWRSGIAKTIIHKSHEINPWGATWVDCVNSRVLDEALKRWEWTFDGRDSFYKIKENIRSEQLEKQIF